MQGSVFHSLRSYIRKSIAVIDSDSTLLRASNLFAQANEMKKLILIALMTVAVTAYKKGRRNSAGPPFDEYPPYQGTHRYLSIHEQHHPFREQSAETQPYQFYRHRSNRQGSPSYLAQLSSRDHSLLKDYSSPRSPAFDDSSSFAEASYFKGRPSFLADGTVIVGDQQDDRFTSHRQSFRDDYRFADLYDTPIGGHKVPGPEHTDSFAHNSDYLKGGNHLHGYDSIPSIASFKNALPLNDEPSTTVTPTTTYKPLQESTVTSTVQGITQHYTSAPSEPQVPSLGGAHALTVSRIKSDTLTDAATIASSASIPTVSTLPTSPAIAQESTNLAHSPPAQTTQASLPLASTESPIVSFARHTVSPIEYQSGKVTAPAASAYYIPNGLKGEPQQSFLNYLLSQQGKHAVKSNEQTSLQNHDSPDTFKNSMCKIQTSLPNYVFAEESKSSLLDYLPTSNRALPFQQSSLPETTNYIPLSAVLQTPRIAHQALPIASLSSISHPSQTIRSPPTSIPRVSAFLNQDSPASPVLPLGVSSGLADSHATNVFNSLSGGIAGDISAGIPAALTPTVPTSIPPFNFPQNIQHFGQLGKFEAPRSQPYSSTGLQLQLGGFGGVDYTLPSTNLAPRSTDFGLAKVGLSLPELPRHQLSVFPKLNFEQPAWQV